MFSSLFIFMFSNIAYFLIQVCDEYKDELETRWKSLLDEAIKDAVFIKSRNQELNQSNKKLSRGLFALTVSIFFKAVTLKKNFFSTFFLKILLRY